MNKKTKQKINKTKLPVNQIICGHNIRTMRKFSDNSIDSIITGPPYGIGFMGKDWDTFVGAEGKAQKCHEENIKAKRRAGDGRIVADSGLGSLAQKAGSYDFSRNAEFQKWFTKWAKECLRVAKPGAFMFVFGGTRTFHRLTCAVEDAGWQIRDCLMWLYGSGFPKSLDISKSIDKAKGKKRKVIGSKRGVRGADGTGSENNMPGKATGIKQVGIDIDITAPTSKLAKLWDGYGTALKPAWEPIIVAMKPVDGNFAKNAERHGVAGLNIDGGRIGTEIIQSPQVLTDSNMHHSYNGKCKSKGITTEHQGRWPANVILDEEAAKILDKQSGIGFSKSGGRSGTTFGSGDKRIDSRKGHNDSGGASRFFYIAKSSRSERNAGLSGMGKKKAFKAGAGMLNGAGKDKWQSTMAQNNHPTVKPLQLMQYLCMLLKMPNKDQIILDPFAGSGTTCVACKELGIGYIGIDNKEDYCEIARKRLANVKASLFEPKRKKKKVVEDPSLFEKGKQ